MKFALLQEGRFKPHADIDGGILWWDLRNVAGTDKSFWGDQKFVWGKQVYGETKEEAIVMAGLGAEIFVTNSLALELQGRVHKLMDPDILDNVGVGDKNDWVLEAKATLSYYFGYFKDTDKDGIQDKYDADPLHPEDVDGYMDTDGAPDYDNDNDGIPDLKDKAPDEAEDKDGCQDEDGVGDLDNDGILGENEKCPNHAEDMNKYQDQDGCPDLDKDNDGIPDDKNKCPNEVETKNGYQDDDGCPETKPMPELEKEGAKLILKGVNFASGSDQLTDESYAILYQVVEGLKDNPEVQIEIRGYTDDRGSAKANQKLYERRASTVMKYLIDSGIALSRFRAVGYGESDPIATNKTKEGSTQNRRIEFMRIN